MQIKTVTITGADNSIDPSELIVLSREFPFVEWGILLSRSSEGKKRFPSANWIAHFKNLCDGEIEADNVQVAAHFCGAWVREIVTGHFTYPYPSLLPLFDRIQLNFHGIEHQVDLPKFADLLNRTAPWAKYIFQMDGVNDQLFHKVRDIGLSLLSSRVHPLFDLSGGNGVVPDEWPAGFHGVFCGYAGGLGPDNLKEQLERIESAVGPDDIWIDMETKVRSDEDKQFDLKKVRECLEIAQLWVR